MKQYFVMILVALAVSSCQMAEKVAPIIDTCEVNKQADIYFTGKINGKCKGISGFGDVIESYGWKGFPSAGGGWGGANTLRDSEPKYFTTGSHFGFGRAYNYLTFEFTFFNKGKANPIARESLDDLYPLKVGKQAWGSNHFITPAKEIKEGVVVRYFTGDMPPALPPVHISYLGEQPESSYFEITKIEPHKNGRSLWITGKFSLRLYSGRQDYPYCDLTDVEFRVPIDKPSTKYSYFYPN